MRKLILLLVIISNSVAAQNYRFNEVAQYERKAEFGGKVHRASELYYTDKDNDNYVLNVKVVNGEIKGVLCDFVIKKYYYLTISKINLDFSLVYDLSQVKDIPDKYTERVYDYKLILSDSLRKAVVMTRYENKSKKKVVERTQVRLNNDGQNLYPFFSIGDCNASGSFSKANNLPKGFVTDVKVLDIDYDNTIKLELREKVGFAMRF